MEGEHTQLLFSIYTLYSSILYSKRQKWVQIFWSFGVSVAPSPINIWNMHHVQKPLIQGHVLLLSFGGCTMTQFHLWGDSRWQWDRWPISPPHCLTDHSVPAACMTVHVSPVILSDAKLHGVWGNTIVCDNSCRKQSCKGAVRGGGLV